MKLLTFLFPVLFLLSCTAEPMNNDSNGSGATADYDYDVEERLQELDIELLTHSAPTANFVRTVRTGNLVFLSGHGPDLPEGGQITGKVGDDLSVEEGQEAARYTGISLLSSLKTEIEDLNNVVRIVKVLGMVNADPGFTQHSQVINGFSDLMVDVFGENGRHARSAVGMGSLPGDIAVEIEIIVEVAE